MTTAPARLTPVTHRLSREHLDRLAQIAAMLAARAGIPEIDRTDALRYAIDRTFASECSPEGVSSARRNAA
jgi:Pyruvate/2-oxoacid:ferredoxin oxidoreductase gamma subunit